MITHVAHGAAKQAAPRADKPSGPPAGKALFSELLALLLDGPPASTRPSGKGAGKGHSGKEAKQAGPARGKQKQKPSAAHGTGVIAAALAAPHPGTPPAVKGGAHQGRPVATPRPEGGRLSAGAQAPSPQAGKPPAAGSEKAQAPQTAPEAKGTARLAAERGRLAVKVRAPAHAKASNIPLKVRGHVPSTSRVRSQPAGPKPLYHFDFLQRPSRKTQGPPGPGLALRHGAFARQDGQGATPPGSAAPASALTQIVAKALQFSPPRTMTLTLQPAHLGQVQVRLSSVRGHLTIHIMAQSQDTLAALQGGAGEVASMLSKGLKGPVTVKLSAQKADRGDGAGLEAENAQGGDSVEFDFGPVLDRAGVSSGSSGSGAHGGTAK